MIFPGEFKHLIEKPSLKISWAILFVNVLIFLAFLIFFNKWPDKVVFEKLNDEEVKNSIVAMYKQTLDPIEKNNLPLNANGIYYRALKDQKFRGRIEKFPFKGDQIRIAENKKIISDFYRDYLESPQYLYGLGTVETSPWAWVTYQFVHSSWLHLLGNILVVFLVISYLEIFVSSFWIAIVYLFSGFAGGIAFLFFDTVGGMSVVGASASVSGLLAFLFCIKGASLMPWGYMMAPIKNGYGQIYLPVFFIFPVFLVSDFVTLLWEPTGIAANVAVSAHVGGVIMGMLLGCTYLIFLRSKASSHRVFSNHDGLHELS